MTTASKGPKAGTVDMKLEVAVIPVLDIDRAERFYENLGWRLYADFVRPDGSWAVQLTPPGSPTSIQLGTGAALPRFPIVNDIEAALRIWRDTLGVKQFAGDAGPDIGREVFGVTHGHVGL